MLRAAVLFGPQKYSEFERHIEPRQSVSGVKTGARQIVNGESAVADYLVQLIHPDLAPVILIPSGACNKSAIVNGKDQSIQQLVKSAIKWDVEEYISCWRAKS